MPPASTSPSLQDPAGSPVIKAESTMVRAWAWAFSELPGQGVF